MNRYPLLWLYLLFFSILSIPLLPTTIIAQPAAHPVLSEVYGGGGNSGSYYRNDFIELYNPTGLPVVMDHWSVQYASPTGPFSTRFVFSGTIAAHGFFLIQCAQGSAGIAPLPTPDTVSGIAMSASNGKIALANDSLQVTGPADANVVDFVGFGSATSFEGTGAAPAPSNTASIERKAQSSSTSATMASGGADSLKGNAFDANDNAADFVLRQYPDPQNSTSPMELPPEATIAIATPLHSPPVPERNGTDTITATVDGSRIAAVRLHLLVGAAPDDSSIAMVRTAGPTFRGVVPSSKHSSSGTMVRFFVSAVDSAGHYASTAAATTGYFVGTSTVAVVKGQALAAAAGCSVRLNGALNAATNLFAAGEAFVQDSSGGMMLFSSAGMLQLGEGRRVTVLGTLAQFNGAYELSDPGLAFVDTSGGSATLSAAAVALPLTESPSSLLDGKLVRVQNLSAGSGIFSAGSILFHSPAGDTLTLRIESNGPANTLVGTPLPGAPTAITGVLSYANGFLRLKPRKAEDAGNTPLEIIEAAVSGRWSDSAVWSTHRVPGPFDHVTFSTLGVAVTVDIPGAHCGDLTMTGSGSAASSGPVLKFDTSGSPALTINGSLSIAGGSGSGQGGRAKLTSNGNPGSTLTILGSIATTTANSTSSGSAGLNMNEGTVRLVGSTSDTLRNSAGFRLANLVVGDGIGGKTLVWSPSKISTMAVRSVRVMPRATFLIGSASDSVANDIGNGTASGVPTLTGGIVVDSGGAMIVQHLPGGNEAAAINLDSGGVVVRGRLVLDTSVGPSARSWYTLRFGGFSRAGHSSQTITGTGVLTCGDLLVGAGDTLTLGRAVALPAGGVLTLDGVLHEAGSAKVTGAIVAKRKVAKGIAESFGGIGCLISVAGAAPDTTSVRRTTGIPAVGNGGVTSILRSFDIRPAVNSQLDASLDLSYDRAELDGQDASTLSPWRSNDGGTTWYNVGLSWMLDTASHVVHLSHVQSMGLWTLADAAHPLGGSTVAVNYSVARSWNIVALPLEPVSRARCDLFPLALSPAFAYDGSYTPAETLRNGRGYWIKFASDSTITLNGVPRFRDTLWLLQGWNLVGGISAGVYRGTILEVPDGIMASPFFGYDNGYVVCDTLRPFLGYWIKAAADGYIVLDAGASQQKPAGRTLPQPFLTIELTDAAGFSQSLFLVAPGEATGMRGALPPLPPAGAPDVRFTSGAFLETIDPGSRSPLQFPISFRSLRPPIMVTWHSSRRDLRPSLLLKDRLLLDLTAPAGRRALGIAGDAELTLSVPSGVPSRYVLRQNYPNPFNPTTAIMYELPVTGKVSVKVYDLLGAEVRALVDEMEEAGYRQVEWDGMRDNGVPVSSGIYFCRMNAVGIDGRAFSAVVKMVVVR